jgi:PEP-CTERM putative exosortase interaction domain
MFKKKLLVLTLITLGLSMITTAVVAKTNGNSNSGGFNNGSGNNGNNGGTNNGSGNNGNNGGTDNSGVDELDLGNQALNDVTDAAVVPQTESIPSGIVVEDQRPAGSVPEPGTFLLLGLGGLAMRLRGRRTNQ